MKVKDLERFYGSRAAAADAINCSRSVVSKWGEHCGGKIPTDFQLQFEVDSKGKLLTDLPRGVRERCVRCHIPPSASVSRKPARDVQCSR